MTIYEENALVEQIASLLDKYLKTEIEDLTNINNLVEIEKKEAKLTQQLQNNLDEINGGSK